MGTEIDAHLWLAKRLIQHRALIDAAGIFDGTTTPDERRERIRRVILEQGLSSVIIGRFNGKPESYADFFQRLFGVALGTLKATETASNPLPEHT